MIYLLYGGDDLSLGESLAAMKQSVEPAELRDVNTAVLEGPATTLQQLEATCDTVPFLADKRVVVVEGLLSMVEPRRPGRAAPGQERSLGPWEGLADYLPRVPETTDLVFVDGPLSQNNRLFTAVRPLAKVLTFPLPSLNELRQWIRQRAESYGVDIEAGAVNALADTIGRNLRLVDVELQKLSIYRQGQTVRDQDVRDLVAYVREASIFAAVDAVLEGRPGTAIRLVRQLLDSGRTSPYVIAMIARQVRLLLLTKELRSQRLPAQEIGKRLSITGFPLRKTLEQEGGFTSRRLEHIHRKLLETDVSIKTGQLDEDLALELMIAELASVPAGR